MEAVPKAYECLLTPSIVGWFCVFSWLLVVSSIAADYAPAWRFVNNRLTAVLLVVVQIALCAAYLGFDRAVGECAEFTGPLVTLDAYVVIWDVTSGER